MSENDRGNTKYENRRFPCEQHIYTKTVGRFLPLILKKTFNDLGFRVEINPLETNGADLRVYLENNLVLVTEVLNWSIGSRLTDKRREKIIENLNEHDCNKLLIHTIPLSNLEGFRENRINRLEIGFQVLPVVFYNFYVKKEQIEKRCINSDSTRKHIKSTILDYVNSYLFGHKYLKFLL